MTDTALNPTATSLTTADGRPLSQALAQASRHARTRAFLLVVPLLFFVLVTFAIPIGHWLRGPLREWAEDLLQADRLAADGLIDPVPVRAAWHAHLSGKADWTPALWSILMLQAWRDRWT